MSKLTQEQIQANKIEFINLLRSSGRENIENLILWLDTKSDFFTAPSSSKYHGCIEGGLCQHSLNVYKAAQAELENIKKLGRVDINISSISNDNLIIATLLHDLCKTNYYKKAIKMFKDDATNSWHHYYTYEVEDNFPIGHGEKSVIMLQNFIKLAWNEILAIRWHMSAHDSGIATSTPERIAMYDSMTKCPLVIILQNADLFATYMMEETIDQKKENLID